MPQAAYASAPDKPRYNQAAGITRARLAQARRAQQKVVAFGAAGRAIRGTPVMADRAYVLTRLLEHMGAHGVQAMVGSKIRVIGKRVQTGQRRRGAVNHGHGDGLVELDERARGKPVEHTIELENLRPVSGFAARRFIVQRGDGGLYLIRTERAIGWH